jgi:hypothetical protein
VKPLTGATGQGLPEILQRFVELVPKWSSFIPAYRLNSWRFNMATGLAGASTGDFMQLPGWPALHLEGFVTIIHAV